MALLEGSSASGYRFEDVTVHLGRRIVTVAGREVHLRPLVFQLLVALCESGGGVAEREALFSRLWPDTRFPSDESLTQLVHRLRGCLGDTGRCVKTLRGVGLRLDAAVVPLEERPRTALAPPPYEPAEPLVHPATRDGVPLTDFALAVLLLNLLPGQGGRTGAGGRRAAATEAGAADSAPLESLPPPEPPL